MDNLPKDAPLFCKECGRRLKYRVGYRSLWAECWKATSFLWFLIGSIVGDDPRRHTDDIVVLNYTAKNFDPLTGEKISG